MEAKNEVGLSDTIVKRFEKQAEAYKDNIAVKSADTLITYGELNRYANRVAGRILAESLNIKPAQYALENLCGQEGRVLTCALLFEHGIAMIAGMLGVLKSGNAYVPLDTGYPADRDLYILTDCNASFLLTNSSNIALAEELKEKCDGLTIINIDNLDNILDENNPGKSFKPSRPAYILYTSGSTGTPKGVVQNHRNILHFIEAYTENLHVDSMDRLAQVSSYCFDAGVMDTYGALLNGAGLFLYDIRAGLPDRDFLDWVDKEEITIYHSTPTVYRHFFGKGATGRIFASVRLVVMGGEKVVRNDVNLYFKHFSEECIFVNGLGPTESTVTLQYFIDKNTVLEGDSVPVGMPVRDTEVYILDENGIGVPAQVTGQMVFKSDFLALGYLNLPEKTAEVFKEGYPDRKGRMYFSGDYGKMLPDGNIVFVERRDFQVKIRGHRIELGEIEAAMHRIPDISRAVALTYKRGEEVLLAVYYQTVHGREADMGFVRRKLAGMLPIYMLPNVFIHVNRLPLTHSGKIDLKALPDPAGYPGTSDEPEDNETRMVAEMWKDVLGLSSIRYDEDFFSLGGHSLKAGTLCCRINEHFGTGLTISQVYQNCTVLEMAELVKKLPGKNPKPIPIVPEMEYYKTSSAQKSLFVVYEIDKESTVYNLPFALSIQGKVDIKRIDDALHRLVKKHESLRTSFHMKEAQIVQRVGKNVNLKLDCIKGEENNIHEIINTFILPFDLSQAPLFRAQLIELSEGGYILLFDIHHIIADGASIEVIIRDFISFYAKQEGHESKLGYKDYVEWEESMCNSPRLKQQEGFWLDMFAGEIKPMDLLYDFNRPAVQAFEGESIHLVLDEALSCALKYLAAKNKTTLFTVLFAAFNILLSKYASCEDVVIGTPVSGRVSDELKGIVGLFVKTLALRSFPTGTKNFIEYLAEIREITVKALENRDYPYENLINKLGIQRDYGRNPLFDIMFVLNEAWDEEAQFPDIIFKPWELPNRVSTFDMTLEAKEKRNCVHFRLEYCTRLFKRGTVEGILNTYKNILMSIVDNPDRPLSQMGLLSEKERKQLLYEFNDTKVGFGEVKTIVELFENQVEVSPDFIAMVYGGKRITYAELNMKANRLAYLLKESGVTKENVVGVLMERSVELITAILAVLKAGGAYLPIDADYPGKRIEYLLKDSGAGFLVTSSSLAIRNEIDTGDIKVISVEDIPPRGGDRNPDRINTPPDLAYVIYTSGTTGEPKGVMVEHQSFVNFAQAVSRVIGRESIRNFLSVTSVSFDVFVFETLVPLTRGLCTVLADRWEQKDSALLGRLIFKQKVDIIQTTPTRIKMLFLDEKCRTYLKGVKMFVSGGEALGEDLFEIITEFVPEAAVYSSYGPAEATAWTTAGRLEKGRKIHIGKPIANTRLYVCDQSMGLVPIGMPGELYIGGAGVARGYICRKALTAEKFIANPYKENERIYKTGDLVRWLPDGNLEFLGRADKQLKIKGFRIEPGEIEYQIMKCGDIRKAVVTTRTDSLGNVDLCAYIDTCPDFNLYDLRNQLAARLPIYMIPAFFIIVDGIPLTHNGKTDFKALQALVSQTVTETKPLTVENEIQKGLVKIWSEVLERVPSTLECSFFEAGGDSLRALYMVTRINREMGVELTVRDIFEKKSIGLISEYIEKFKGATYSHITKIEGEPYYAVSPAQKRMYILNRFETSGVQYNMPGAIRISGDLDIEGLRASFRKLVSRHEILRTSFNMQEGQPVQIIHDDVEIDINVVCVQEKETKSKINGFIRPFVLSEAPLIRVQLLKLAEDMHILLFDMHHIVSDGMSLKLFFDELTCLYGGKEVPELQVQYKDYSVWKNRQLLSYAVGEQERYWLDVFRGEIPAVELPTDFKRPVIQNYEGSRMYFSLNRELTGRIKELAKETNSTVYTVLFSAYSILLSRHTGCEDIVIGTSSTGRSHFDLMNLVGMFVNTLAIRCYPGGEKSFKEYLDEMKVRLLTAMENQDYPFELLVEKLDIERSLDRTPLFNTMFIMQDDWMHGRKICGLDFEPIRIDHCAAKFDITLEAMEKNAEIVFVFEYCSRLFKTDTMVRFYKHFIRIVDEISRNPGIEIQAIDMLEPEEKEQLIYGFNDTKTDAPIDKTIHRLFEEQVSRNPLKEAVVYGNYRLTYAQLYSRAGGVEWCLRQAGIGCGDIVVIMAERSMEFVIGILGILRAGAAYMPMDMKDPIERKRLLYEEAAAKALITLTQYRAEAAEIVGSRASTVIYLDDLSCDRKDVEVQEDNAQTGSQLAYVMFTSGSTGRPKGCKVLHKNVIRLVKEPNFISFNHSDRILMTGAISFDASTFEIWGSLLNGLTLHIVEESAFMDSTALEKALRDYGITILWLTSPLFNQLSDRNPRLFSGLKYLLVGGDKLSPSHINKVRVCNPGLSIINGYGPTENTTFTTCFTIDGEYEGNIPIGKPISNTKVYILDDYNHLQPIGVYGELCTGGEGVCSGYLNDMKRTVEKFADDPFYSGKKMYRTGDKARWVSDGNIEIQGRNDRQVKVRGYRVELDEVETVLRKHPMCSEACVEAFDNENGEKDLYAYIVAEEEISPGELREYMGKCIPEYMIPAYFFKIDKIPLNKNGKIDRKALIQSGSKLKNNCAYVAPTSREEEILLDIWSETLGHEKIGVQDNFFELGGHSLKALQIIEKAKDLGIDITMKDIFRFRTVHSILKNAGGEKTAVKSEMPQESRINKYREKYKNKTKNILPVKKQTEITTYLCRALPMCIIAAYENMIPWFYTHFVNICSQVSPDGYVILDYLEPLEIFQDVIDYQYKGYKKMDSVRDIVGYVIEAIDSDSYISVCLDEFYLSAKAHYNKEHFVHESLVYGYDVDEGSFYAIGFNARGMMEKVTFDFEMFLKAFHEGKQHYKADAWYAEEQAVGVLKPLSAKKYKFDSAVFLEDFNNYNAASGEKERMYMITPPLQQERDMNELRKQLKVRYGMDVYEDVLFALNELAAGNRIIDYRAFHLLVEHKKLILIRLGHMRIYGQFSGEIVKLEDRYRRLAEEAERARLLFLELENSYDLCNQMEREAICFEIMHIINFLKKDEREIMKKLHNHYKVLCDAELEEAGEMFF